MKLLAVDDDMFFRGLLRRMLDPESELATADSRPPDGVLQALTSSSELAGDSEAMA